jgi:hypothetical protein
MGLHLKLIFVAIVLSISMAVFLALRRGAIRGGFVAFWMLVCMVMISIPLFDAFYKWLAQAMGLFFAIDMIYVFSILFLMLYVFYLTVKIQNVQDISYVLMSKCAILESLVRKDGSVNRIEAEVRDE